MRSEYKDAFVSRGRRMAFDRLVEGWSSELGAISYAELMPLMDLLLFARAGELRRITLQEVEVRTRAVMQKVGFNPSVMFAFDYLTTVIDPALGGKV